MANYKANADLMSALSDEDCTCLELIARMRCLTESLAHRYVYSMNASKATLTKDRIKALCEAQLLEQVEYGKGEPALFLTTLGVQAVRSIPRMRHSMDVPSMEVKSAYDLKLKRQSINHQMCLNEFVLGLFARMSEREGFTYLDAKYMPPCSQGMMPDAMIDAGTRLFLLEMDMGNERTPHLELKWNNYRAFLANPEDFYYGKAVTMVFVLGGVTVVSQRKNTVISSLSRLLIDRIGPAFEVYAETPARLWDLLPERLTDARRSAAPYQEAMAILQSRHGFMSAEASFLGGTLSYDAYIRKLTPQNKIVVQNGRPQEFLVDIWEDNRLSVLHSILYFQSSVLELWSRFKRDISYLVVAPDEKWLDTMLLQGRARGAKGVYFTTSERLKKRAFPEALFQIDEAGALYHFLEPSLMEREYERKFA